jgi:hypothetical protein
MTSPIRSTEIYCDSCTGHLFWIDEQGPVEFLVCFSCQRGYTYKDGQKKRIEWSI